VQATVLPGYGVASGRSGDPRFPGGTLAMQAPYFRERGLDLSPYHLGTLNLSIAPSRYRVLRPRLTLCDVRWHPTEPAEDFSFFDCRLTAGAGATAAGLIYYPHPETKPDHVQPVDVLEVLAPRIAGLGYGDAVVLEVRAEQLEVHRGGA
jgi:hypothetical protein